MRETSTLADRDSKFGAQLYEAFRAVGRMNLVTQAFSYDAIQRLKHADRSEVLRLYTGKSKWDFVQRLKCDSPEEVVDYLIVSERQKGERQQRIHMLFIIPLMVFNCSMGILNQIQNPSELRGMFTMVVFNTILTLGAIAIITWTNRKWVLKWIAPRRDPCPSEAGKD